MSARKAGRSNHSALPSNQVTWSSSIALERDERRQVGEQRDVEAETGCDAMPANRRALLTAEEVAGILRVSERYVWRLGRDGDLPRVNMGKYVRFDACDVEEFIAIRKVNVQVRRASVEQSRQSIGVKAPIATRKRF